MSRFVFWSSLAVVGEAAHWAVLAAGSRTYSNYRHQADLCHGYKLLIEKGFDPDHIITLSYDDVANDRRNPFPGKLFNKPGNPGVDVYSGCQIDYKGSDVSASNFVKVLTGDASLPKTLQSTSDDHVFVSFYDHGGVGIIAFPGGTLHKKDMQDAFQTMHDKGMYKKLTFYLEACESGSMFEGMDIPGVYAVSAANAHESSYGTYCGSQAQVNGRSIGSCLGDLFSVNWMEDSDAKDITTESLSSQFQIVQQKTRQSHVLQWSDTSFTSDMVSDFQGTTKADKAHNAVPVGNSSASAVSVRLLELQQAYDRYVHAEGSADRLLAGEDLQTILQDQLKAESAYEKFLEIVYPGDDDRQAAARERVLPPNNRDCEMAARESFLSHGDFDASSGFAMQFHKYIVNVCADDSANVDVVEAARQACQHTTMV